MSRQIVLDILFRLRWRRGYRVPCPPDLCECVIAKRTEFTVVYHLRINEHHPIAEWLNDDCEGPWAVGMTRPLHRRERYLGFSRAADAVLFQLRVG